VPVIASGGAGALEHFHDVVAQAGVAAVLAASVFHFRTFSVRQVKEYLASRGVPVDLYRATLLRADVQRPVP